MADDSQPDRIWLSSWRSRIGQLSHQQLIRNYLRTLELHGRGYLERGADSALGAVEIVGGIAGIPDVGGDGAGRIGNAAWRYGPALQRYEAELRRRNIPTDPREAQAYLTKLGTAGPGGP
jgi:hypothetical protein